MGKLRHRIPSAHMGAGQSREMAPALSQLTSPVCGSQQSLLRNTDPSWAVAEGLRSPAGADSRQNLAGLAEKPLAKRRGTGLGLPRPLLVARFPEISRSAASRNQQKASGGELGACLPVLGCTAALGVSWGQAAGHREAGVPSPCGWPLERGDPRRNGPWGPVPQPVFIQHCPLYCLGYPKERGCAPKPWLGVSGGSCCPPPPSLPSSLLYGLRVP